MRFFIVSESEPEKQAHPEVNMGSDGHITRVVSRGPALKTVFGSLLCSLGLDIASMGHAATLQLGLASS